MDEKIEKLKKGYWGNLCKASFRENQEGQTIFFIGGPFSKSYVIDSDDTEIRLREKLIKCYKWMLAFIVAIVAPFSIMLMSSWILLLGLLFLTSLAQKIWFKIVFTEELSQLQQVSERVPLKQFYADMAAKHSKKNLSFGFLGSISAVLVSFSMINTDGNYAPVAWICILFFGACAVAWGYMLMLKKNSK